MVSSCTCLTSSSTKPMRRKVVIILLLVIIVVAMWIVGLGGGDEVSLGKDHHPALSSVLPDQDDKQHVGKSSNGEVTVKQQPSHAIVDINNNKSSSTPHRNPSDKVVVGSGGDVGSSSVMMSCEAKRTLQQRIQYFEDSLSDTIAVLGTDKGNDQQNSNSEGLQTTDTTTIIKAGSSSSGSSIGSSSATGRFSLECTQRAFEENFRASVLEKRAELRRMLKQLKALLLLKQEEEGSIGGGNGDEEDAATIAKNKKKGTMLPVFNATLASSNQLHTPLIAVDELVHGGPCRLAASGGGSDVCSSTAASPTAVSSDGTDTTKLRQRRQAIEEVISASSTFSNVSVARKGIHVYMVHYTPMKQRREAISKLLHRHRIFPEWVTGFDKDDINPKMSGCITGGETNLKPSQVSVVVKHHSALYDAVRFKRPLSLILEDDALLRYDVAGRLGDLLVEVYHHRQKAAASTAPTNNNDNNNTTSGGDQKPHHYLDVMWVGGCIKMHGYRRKYNTVRISPHLFEKREARCAHAYLVSYVGAKRLLGNFPLSRPIDFQLTDAMKTAATAATATSTSQSSSPPSSSIPTPATNVVSLWVEPWLSIQGDMGGCVTNDIGAKCITVVKKYDPAFDGEKLPTSCTSATEGAGSSTTTRGNASAHLPRPFVDLWWDRVPKHGSS